jgi:hypothetical protein
MRQTLRVWAGDDRPTGAAFTRAGGADRRDRLLCQLESTQVGCPQLLGGAWQVAVREPVPVIMPARGAKPPREHLAGSEAGLAEQRGQVAPEPGVRAGDSDHRGGPPVRENRADQPVRQQQSKVFAANPRAGQDPVSRL